MEYFDDDIPEAIEDPFADETGNHPEGENDDKEENKDKPKKKRVGAGPRSLQEKHLLNPKTGLLALPKYFLNNAGEMKHWEEGKELENIDEFMNNMERWCHNMYPKWQLDHCLEKIERLGVKMPIKNAMTRIRAGDEQFEYELEQQYNEENKNNNPEQGEQPVNQYYNTDLMQPSGYSISTERLQNRAPAALSEDMQAKIAENRRKALERRKQKEQQQQSQMQSSSQDES